MAFIIDTAAAGPEPTLILRGAMEVGRDQQVALLCVEADLHTPAGVDRAVNDATDRLQLASLLVQASHRRIGILLPPAQPPQRLSTPARRDHRSPAASPDAARRHRRHL